MTEQSTFRRLLPYFKPHLSKLILAIGCMLTVTAVHLARPMVLRVIIDKAVPQQNIELAMKYAGLFLAFLALGAIAMTMRVRIMARMGAEIVAKIKTEVFEHILSQGVSFFDKNQPGRLISRTESDVDQIKSMFTQESMQVFSSIMLVVGTIAFLFMENVIVGFITIASLALVSLVMYCYLSYIQSIITEVRTQNSLLTGQITEYIQGIPLIQLYRREEEVKNRLHNFSQKKGDLDVYASFIDYAIGSSTFRLISEIGVLGVLFFYCSKEIYAGAMTVGTMVMFIELLRQFFRPLGFMVEAVSSLQSALAAGVRVFAILDSKPAITNEGLILPDEELTQDITFNSVNFSYNSEPVLKNISFKIEKGKTVAIVGKSGSGKTTCANLLLRFYDPDSGSICIGNQNIKEIQPENLLKNTALVLQEIYLFPGTIMQNLKAFRNDIDDESVIKASREIGAHSFIQKLSKGYETVLAERGSNLSYGERQLLSYTRALVKDPKLLILDEATSSVDAITEMELQNSMAKLMKNRTSLVIAHRLSTIKNADKIIVLEKGEIIESGTHEELIKLGKKYYELVNIQNGNKAP
ncbi:MAG: ABC transporter ATP-binding protein [Candidatus Riflebacteria bacterium]|nr:ABC transporter ATP-binding protein [Candidatus Riflebacteria bacterium]